jgi:hypothetical protein
MAGRRRVQRSVRVRLASALICLAAGAVAIALAAGSSGYIDVAAVVAVAAGAIAARVLYCELLQTRRDTCRSRADQALAFASALADQRTDHAHGVEGLRAAVLRRDRCVSDLDARLRAAQERADTAYALAERETRRADDAHARLLELLDAVLARPVATVTAAEDDDLEDGALAETRELPTVVDLLAWEERTNGARADRARRHA